MECKFCFAIVNKNLFGILTLQKTDVKPNKKNVASFVKFKMRVSFHSKTTALTLMFS